jgi:hypothetical protein
MQIQTKHHRIPQTTKQKIKMRKTRPILVTPADSQMDHPLLTMLAHLHSKFRKRKSIKKTSIICSKGLTNKLSTATLSLTPSPLRILNKLAQQLSISISQKMPVSSFRFILDNSTTFSASFTRLVRPKTLISKLQSLHIGLFHFQKRR